MRKLLVGLFMLIAPVAYAQVGPEVYRIATPSQFQGINTSSQSITAALNHQMVRVTCTADCFIDINSEGRPVTVATGTFLPADVPATFHINKGNTLYVIGNAAGGVVYVQELSK